MNAKPKLAAGSSHTCAIQAGSRADENPRLDRGRRRGIGGSGGAHRPSIPGSMVGKLAKELPRAGPEHQPARNGARALELRQPARSRSVKQGLTVSGPTARKQGCVGPLSGVSQGIRRRVGVLRVSWATCPREA
jgi:hypothetical protein